jgi:type III pantothenate kinase
MFLAVDIGNTTTAFGLFLDREFKASIRVKSSYLQASNDRGNEIMGQLRSQFDEDYTVETAGICSVVPALTESYILMLKEQFKVIPKLLTHETKVGFKVFYDDPSRLGTDRLANVIAARELYGYPAIVVDLGTASKYDVINSDGDYIGGIIAPGVWTSAMSLFDNAAQLFQVNLEKPKTLVGGNTADCLKSGIYYGFVGQLRYLIERIKDELGCQAIRVVGTGGYAEIFASETDLLPIIDTELTLKGLQLALGR